MTASFVAMWAGSLLSRWLGQYVTLPAHIWAMIMAAFAYFLTFRAMGRDYDAVMAGGQCGFGLGSTSNAVANMEAIAERFGVAPRAFVVVPRVGAFFIDFANAPIFTGFIKLVH